MADPIVTNAGASPDGPASLSTVSLLGFRLARVDRRQLLDHIFLALRNRQGGWLVTANLDFLRRYVKHPEARELYDKADIRVADGMPLVWACRVQRTRIPERVPGSSLVWLLVERAAAEGRSVYLLGGAPGAGERAADVLLRKNPNLKLCGRSSPQISSPPSPAEVKVVLAELARAQPDILLVALGSPKQEQLIHALREHLPSTWSVGIGISLSFVAGDVKRAPTWMRRMGLEWLHRMLQEPRRLMRRYLVDDLPFALRLFGQALLARWRRGR
jgi:N-acetylglucosaminyldiphosphoundecaprenol N-acetyl-beta-D-mannosaminyltransferase